ncbi:MAG: shufflon system plasmid conjugative transfer pilus tip adhesin PilV [Planctomycetes bacterium]|nr:shufflon system plasmid conjugative transfer pilus tip adhesin PilV [Planctomycetota bacterium]
MTWNGSAIGAAYGGTGLNTSGSSGVPTISSGTWSINSALPVSRGGTGTTTTFTQGSVVFAGASGVYTQDNAAFFWDDTSNRLGLGIATPSNTLHLHSASSWTDIQFTSNTTGTGDYQGVKIGTNTAAGDAFFWVYEVQPLSLGTSGTERLVVEADGDIAIKAGALTMNGNTAIDAGAGWHRSYGSTGWYNSTYAGGWHMSDATWIRSYNSKNVYCDVVIRADGGFQVDGNTVIDGDAGWHRTYGATGWYNGTYGGGWYMTDSTWVRVYNDKPVEIGGSTYSASLRYDGIIDPASTSDGNQIYGMPSGSTTGSGWGYVGDSDTYWYYMYSQNFIDPSRREYKKDITSLNDGINRHVMADLDRLNPVLYRYKGESRDMVPGHERRYRPNLHLGLLLEDVPDYLQDQAFSGVDLYALGVMGIVGAKENRKEIRSLRRTLASFQDVGTGVAAGETWVPFSAEFASYLEGRAPVVTITPTSANRGYYVRETTVRGFRVVAEAPFAFNWLATARPTVACEEAPDVPEAVRQELQVPPDRKLQATKYWAADSAGKRQEYEAYLRHLEETDPAKHARVVGENRRNEAFLAEQSR